MSLTIDRVGRHIDAGPAAPDATIGELAAQGLRDTAFRLARRRFLGEIETAAGPRLDGDNP